MELTTILATLGAASGLTGTVLSVLNYRRDRPIIIVTSHTHIDSAQHMFVVVDVRNEGRHGVTLTAIGLAVAPSPTGRRQRLLHQLPILGRRLVIRRIDRQGVRYSDFAVILEDDGTSRDEQVFLEPGRKVTRRIDMAEASRRTRAGVQAWPYAEDFAGQTFLSRQPAPVQDPDAGDVAW